MDLMTRMELMSMAFSVTYLLYSQNELNYISALLFFSFDPLPAK